VREKFGWQDRDENETQDWVSSLLTRALRIASSSLRAFSKNSRLMDNGHSPPARASREVSAEAFAHDSVAKLICTKMEGGSTRLGSSTWTCNDMQVRRAICIQLPKRTEETICTATTAAWSMGATKYEHDLQL
jgi:hypothetical protein